MWGNIWKHVRSRSKIASWVSNQYSRLLRVVKNQSRIQPWRFYRTESPQATAHSSKLKDIDVKANETKCTTVIFTAACDIHKFVADELIPIQIAFAFCRQCSAHSLESDNKWYKKSSYQNILTLLRIWLTFGNVQYLLLKLSTLISGRAYRTWKSYVGVRYACNKFHKIWYMDDN